MELPREDGAFYSIYVGDNTHHSTRGIEPDEGQRSTRAWTV